MRIQQTQTIGILSLIALCVSVGGSLWLMYFIDEQRDAFEEQVVMRAETRATYQQLDALTTLVGETESERAELATYVLTEQSVADFLTRLEESAKGVGVSIETQSLAVVPLPDTNTFEVLALTVSAQGSYDAVTHVLELFESLPYQVTLERVELEVEGEGGVGWRGTYALEVTKEVTP